MSLCDICSGTRITRRFSCTEYDFSHELKRLQLGQHTRWVRLNSRHRSTCTLHIAYHRNSIEIHQMECVLKLPINSDTFGFCHWFQHSRSTVMPNKLWGQRGKKKKIWLTWWNGHWQNGSSLEIMLLFVANPLCWADDELDSPENWKMCLRYRYFIRCCRWLVDDPKIYNLVAEKITKTNLVCGSSVQ